jgi:hypothetical protein
LSAWDEAIRDPKRQGSRALMLYHLSEHVDVPMNYWDMVNTICLASPIRGQKDGPSSFLMLGVCPPFATARFKWIIDTQTILIHTVSFPIFL